MSVHIPIPEWLDYTAKGSNKVTARVVIGDAQGGGWVIRLDDTLVAKGSEPDPIEIGKASELKGKLLQVTVTCVDVRPETNRLSCVVTIDGGPDGRKPKTHRWDDGDDGDIVLFSTMVDFV